MKSEFVLRHTIGDEDKARIRIILISMYECLCIHSINIIILCYCKLQSMIPVGIVLIWLVLYPRYYTIVHQHHPINTDPQPFDHTMSISIITSSAFILHRNHISRDRLASGPSACRH